MKIINFNKIIKVINILNLSLFFKKYHRASLKSKIKKNKNKTGVDFFNIQFNWRNNIKAYQILKKRENIFDEKR